MSVTNPFVFGCIKSPKDERDFRYALAAPGQRVVLPRKVDYSGQMSPVSDQGKDASCVGFAVKSMREWQQRKDEWPTVYLSAQFVYEEARKIDSFPDETGATDLRSAMKVLLHKGICSAKCWPYKGTPCTEVYGEALKYRISVYERLYNVNDIKTALALNGPLVMGTFVFKRWFEGHGRISDTILESKDALGGHAICITGYNDSTQMFKFINSWGVSWGEKGFGYLSYDYAAKYGFDIWTSKDIITMTGGGDKQMPEETTPEEQVPEEQTGRIEQGIKDLIHDSVREALAELKPTPMPVYTRQSTSNGLEIIIRVPILGMSGNVGLGAPIDISQLEHCPDDDECCP